MTNDKTTAPFRWLGLEVEGDVVRLVYSTGEKIDRVEEMPREMAKSLAPQIRAIIAAGFTRFAAWEINPAAAPPVFEASRHTTVH